ncbi:hypothetical protein PsorP6_005537 [Peronosclerospora sorghi]|uniref:Uncharacterized protein n=1 Tax=Peronosclerospora sorghi TaxID=230839 RepID=A0ACC0W8E5_9STRA|nr:hypothetical protein PsorP6_005537 [Peronosclerospora sorghi]
MIATDWHLISQGAEAKVFETSFAGRACIVKERMKKSYRLPVLDKKLSHRRLIQEARCIVKCSRAGVLTPTIFLVDEDTNRLYLEKVEGGSLKEYLRRAYKRDTTYGPFALQKAYLVGEAIAKMHDADVVHGDLTTSNILLSSDDATDVTMIDFGLASSQPLPEDKAVDLYVMERAFASTHINSELLVGARKCVQTGVLRLKFTGWLSRWKKYYVRIEPNPTDRTRFFKSFLKFACEAVNAPWSDKEGEKPIKRFESDGIGVMDHTS